MELYQQTFKKIFYRIRFSYITKHTTASLFLPVLVLGWTVVGLFAGALICLFLHNTTALVKATIVLCSGGYAGLIFGFLGGIFYIYKDAASLPHTATGLYNHQNTHLA